MASNSTGQGSNPCTPAIRIKYIQKDDSMYYRFNDGSFIEAENFEEAKEKKLYEICQEVEDEFNWHECTCVGISHRFDCPVMKDVIPY